MDNLQITCPICNNKINIDFRHIDMNNYDGHSSTYISDHGYIGAKQCKGSGLDVWFIIAPTTNNPKNI